MAAASFLKDSATCASSGLHPEEDAAHQAVENHETIFKFYVAIINPSTGCPMLHLKQYGDYTSTDLRACINHYESTADTCCVLYAPLSLRAFHYRVHFGFLSNKTRVVLHDTRHQTYVFVTVENVDHRAGEAGAAATMESIMKSVQHQEGYGTLGSDLLQAQSKTNPAQVGYFFNQPITHHRQKYGGQVSIITSKVMTQREWTKRLKAEKAGYDCQRRLLNEEVRRQASTGGCPPRHCAPDKTSVTTVSHTPTIMILSPDFNLRPRGLSNGRA